MLQNLEILESGLLGRVKDHSAGREFCKRRFQGRLGRVKVYSAERSGTRPGCWSLGRVTPQKMIFLGLIWRLWMLAVGLKIVSGFF